MVALLCCRWRRIWALHDSTGVQEGVSGETKWKDVKDFMKDEEVVALCVLCPVHTTLCPALCPVHNIVPGTQHRARYTTSCPVHNIVSGTPGTVPHMCLPWLHGTIPQSSNDILEEWKELAKTLTLTLPNGSKSETDVRIKKDYLMLSNVYFN